MRLADYRITNGRRSRILMIRLRRLVFMVLLWTEKPRSYRPMEDSSSGSACSVYRAMPFSCSSVAVIP